MTEEIKTIKVFCAREQQETDHILDIDGNGEIILTCTSDPDASGICGRFLKYPKETDIGTLKTHLENHKKANEGQVSLEESERHKKELIDGLTSKE